MPCVPAATWAPSSGEASRVKVAIVLHAHLPYVRAESPWTVEERWYHDALWTCYLPLLEVIEEGPLTLSLSPPLIEMMRDPVLASRFEAHLDALDELNEAHRDRTGDVGTFYARRIAGARTRWLHHRGDVLGRLREAWNKARIELWTTAITHGFLPGLAVVDGAVEAQVRLGRAVFESAMARPATGFWIPECGIDSRVAARIGADGEALSVVDAHAIDAPGIAHGLTLWPRHLQASHRVWSRQHGYPRHPIYREFHRDLGQTVEAPGPFGRGTMTGLKLHRIDGAPYSSRNAEIQAKRDAADFVRWLARVSEEETTLVAAYDAELFGHWWFEGPIFLREVLAGIAGHPKLSLATMSQLDRPDAAATPEASSWGRGGDHAVWVGPRTAHLWRHIHGTARLIRDAVSQYDSVEAPGLDYAIIQGLQLQASDWAFALEDGSAADYAADRIRGHRRGVRDGLTAARTGQTNLPDVARGGFLSNLSSETLRSAFRRAEAQR